MKVINCLKDTSFHHGWGSQIVSFGKDPVHNCNLGHMMSLSVSAAHALKLPPAFEKNISHHMSNYG
jgi:uracil DNA glycosylase